MKSVEETLTKVDEALAELRTEVRHAHEATRAMREQRRASREELELTIRDQVRDAIEHLGADIVAVMKKHATAMVEGIEADWRTRLGLEPRR